MSELSTPGKETPEEERNDGRKRIQQQEHDRIGLQDAPGFTFIAAYAILKRIKRNVQRRRNEKGINRKRIEAHRDRGDDA